MADDVKLTLGIDVEALQRSASQATNVLAQTFEKSISANLLGSGLVPNQAAAAPAGQGSGNNIAGIISALQRVNQTLIVGFNALAGGVYLGGGGGAGGGGGGGGGAGTGGGGAAGAAGLAPPTPGTGVAGGGFGIAGQILSRAGDLAAALMPSSMKMIMGGYYGTDVMGFAHNLVSQIPIAGKLLGAVTSPFHQVMQQNDEFKNMQYESFRDGGEDAMNTFTNLWVDDDKRNRLVKRYGFSRGETQQLVQSGYRRGVGGDRGGGSAIETILNMQGQLGLGAEAADTMGGLRRGGLKQGQETEVLANAIGVAVQTGLERGRWGEMLTMWQRAAASSIDTDVAWKEVAAQQQFIGGLGARFKGDTPAAQSMDQSLRQMASNVQSPLALRGAMQLTGGDYFGATARMARAAEQPDTELQERIIDQMMGTAGVRAWLAMPDGPDADRALDRLAGVAQTFGTGLSQLKIITLLKARKGTQGALFKGSMPEAVDIGRQQITGGAQLPGTAIAPRQSQSEAQRPSGISSIQGIGPVAPMSPQDQLRTSPVRPPTVDDLQSGRYTIDMPAAPSSAAGGAAAGAGQGAGAASYQQFVTQKFGAPISGRAPHPGVDLAFPPGTAVTCPVDGIVEHVNRNGAGMEVGAAVHIRADADGVLWKLYHIDPATFPPNLRAGQRVTQGTPLGRTYSVKNWQAPGGGPGVRTHLHVGQTSASGAGLDPMRPGGIVPGSLTGGTVPGGGSVGGSSGNAGPAGAMHVTADVHVHVHNDPAGRPVVRVRGATPAITSSPGQLVGGGR